MKKEKIRAEEIKEGDILLLPAIEEECEEELVKILSISPEVFMRCAEFNFSFSYLNSDFSSPPLWEGESNQGEFGADKGEEFIRIIL